MERLQHTSWRLRINTRQVLATGFRLLVFVLFLVALVGPVGRQTIESIRACGATSNPGVCLERTWTWIGVAVALLTVAALGTVRVIFPGQDWLLYQWIAVAVIGGFVITMVFTTVLVVGWRW